MAHGMGTLRLAPPVFWALSLPEWRALTAPRDGNAALSRAELDAMMKRFPD